jgi:fatty-acyl-CoA synthase
MQGLMMEYPLTLTRILERSERLFPKKEIASRALDGSMSRYTYADYFRRVHRLAHVLERLGVREGDRVGTLCWNTSRHIELYFAIPCSGAVLHTLNLRLSADQLAFIINHAANKVIFVDASLVPLLDAIRDQIPCVERFVIMEDTEIPPHGLTPIDDYEQLLASAPEERFPWPALDENTACATCYTSGTTGNPKGVLYTHRCLFLHSMGMLQADGVAVSERDTLLQIVPMFHANGWGLPFAAIMAGSRIVLSGRHLQPVDIATLIQCEHVTLAGGVPTIWMALYAFLEHERFDISSLRLVICGGSALPRQFVELYAKKYGVQIMLLWGMTETSPLATMLTYRSHLDGLPESERFEKLSRHGMALPAVEVRVVDELGNEVPFDGKTMGELQVRGAWVTSGYFQDESNHIGNPNAPSFSEGWFRTGDVATIDEDGYIQIMDRTKDLVKSGGEWISSVDLENAIMSHPKVAEAAVIAVPHPKWQERPLAAIAPLPQFRDSITKEEILDFLCGKVAKWWLPDDIIFIDAVPKTSVGKFNKRALREQFKDYQPPLAATPV